MTVVRQSIRFLFFSEAFLIHALLYITKRNVPFEPKGVAPQSATGDAALLAGEAAAPALKVRPLEGR